MREKKKTIYPGGWQNFTNIVNDIHIVTIKQLMELITNIYAWCYTMTSW